MNKVDLGIFFDSYAKSIANSSSFKTKFFEEVSCRSKYVEQNGAIYTRDYINRGKDGMTGGNLLEREVQKSIERDGGLAVIAALLKELSFLGSSSSYKRSYFCKVCKEIDEKKYTVHLFAALKSSLGFKKFGGRYVYKDYVCDVNEQAPVVADQNYLKGMDYELEVCNYLDKWSLGVNLDVIRYSAYKGLDDRGIDVIFSYVHNSQLNIFLIQAKNWNSKTDYKLAAEDFSGVASSSKEVFEEYTRYRDNKFYDSMCELKNQLFKIIIISDKKSIDDYVSFEAELREEGVFIIEVPSSYIDGGEKEAAGLIGVLDERLRVLRAKKDYQVSTTEHVLLKFETFLLESCLLNLNNKYNIKLTDII